MEWHLGHFWCDIDDRYRVWNEGPHKWKVFIQIRNGWLKLGDAYTSREEAVKAVEGIEKERKLAEKESGLDKREQ